MPDAVVEGRPGMSVRLVRAGERAVEVWANGAGVTEEVFAERDAAGLRWRLSVATIDGAAEFSRFDGVDRQLMPLDGAVELRFPAGNVVVQPREVLAFRGEEAVSGRPVGSSTRVLNLFADRSRLTGQLELADGSGDAGTRCRATAGYVLEGRAELPSGEVLRPGDAWWGPDAPVVVRGVVAAIRIGAGTPAS